VTARRLPDSFGRYYMVRGEAVRAAVQRHRETGGAVVIGTDEFSEAMPLAPWRDAARWYGVTEDRMKRWRRDGVVYAQRIDGRWYVGCPQGAREADWGAVVGYLMDRVGRDGLRAALGQGAGNTRLHAWARGDATPGRWYRKRLRRLFVREKWREAAGQ